MADPTAPPGPPSPLSPPARDGSAPEAAARALRALRQLNLRLDRYRLSIATHAGISLTESQLVNYLIAAGPSPVGDLARATGLRSSVVTGILDRLETKGIVGRRGDDSDRRRRVIYLKPDRSEDLKQLARFITSVFDDMDEAELDTATALLQTIDTRLEAVIEEITALPPLAPAPRRLR